MQVSLTLTGDLKSISTVAAKLAGGGTTAEVVIAEENKKKPGRPTKEEQERKRKAAAAEEAKAKKATSLATTLELDDEIEEEGLELGDEEDLEEPSDAEDESEISDDEEETEEEVEVAPAKKAAKLIGEAMKPKLIKAFQDYSKKHSRAKAGLILKKFKAVGPKGEVNLSYLPEAYQDKVLKLLIQG